MAIFHDDFNAKRTHVCAHPALNDSAYVDTMAGFGWSHRSVTTIAFMDNSRF